MKTKIFMIVCAGLTFCACGGSGSKTADSKLTVCSFDKVKNTETIPLGGLVENCSLIQFEDIDEALFKPWFTTVTDKYIGVRQQDGSPFKLFDRSGKFLCDVGSVGQGPGEYAIALYDEIIDDKNELIYLAPMVGDKILVYNTAGKFVKNIVAPQRLNKPKLHLSNGILTVVHMPFGKDEAMAIQFDANDKVINLLKPPAHLVVGSFDGEIFNTRNTPAFEFAHTGSDTLYHYNVENNTLQPVFTMTDESSSYKQYFELENCYLTNVFGKGLVATDKKAQTSSFIKIVNDSFGNMAMPASVMNFRNGWYVYNLEPAQLQEAIEKRLSESSCTEKDKETLNKVLSTLDENANNMLFIGKLKTL